MVIIVECQHLTLCIRDFQERVDWGIEPVACTRFCEQPGLPHVGGTKDPDVAAIVELAPDLVVVDAEEIKQVDTESIGIISEPNAHPLNSELLDASGPYVVGALNGDVDNYKTLIQDQGIRIEPEITTDAKVIPALVSRRLAAVGVVSTGPDHQKHGTLREK